MIELVIVLALFGILASIAVPKFTLISRFKENQELREFKRDVLYARNQAIVKGKEHSVSFDYDTNSYVILEELKVIKRYNFEHGIILIKKPFNVEKAVVSYIKFGKNGRPTVSGSIALMTSDKTIYKLSTTPVTGKVSLAKLEDL